MVAIEGNRNKYVTSSHVIAGCREKVLTSYFDDVTPTVCGNNLHGDARNYSITVSNIILKMNITIKNIKYCTIQWI